MINSDPRASYGSRCSWRRPALTLCDRGRKQIIGLCGLRYTVGCRFRGRDWVDFGPTVMQEFARTAMRCF